MGKMNIETINKQLKDQAPDAIVRWALSVAKTPVITTNFRPYEGAILHLVSQIKKDIAVIWCDTGYNTPDTYRHARELTELLDLNIDLFIPKQTAAYRDASIGIPSVDDPLHAVFTEQVKLEPFKRAMNKYQPDVWFTNLRKGQTAFRDRIDIVSIGADGVLKVSPFYYWSDSDLDRYLKEKGVPNEFNYYDPTKQLAHRECGLHS